MNEKREPNTSTEAFIKTTTDAAGKEFTFPMVKAWFESTLIGDDLTEHHTRAAASAWLREKKAAWSVANEKRKIRKANRERADRILTRLGKFRDGLDFADYVEDLPEEGPSRKPTSLSDLDRALAHLAYFVEMVNPDGTIPDCEADNAE